jgi:hypothetical protein
LKKIPDPIELPVFIVSRTKRGVGLHGASMAFLDNEFNFQMLALIDILSTLDEAGLARFKGKEVYAYLASGIIFPWRKITHAYLIRGLEATIGNGSSDLSGIENEYFQSRNEINKDNDSRNLVFGMAKDYFKDELLSAWRQHEQIFRLEYLRKKVKSAEARWKTFLREFIAGRCQGVENATQSLGKYLEIFFGGSNYERIQFDYETPYKTVTVDTESQIDDFDRREWQPLQKRKKKGFLYIALASFLFVSLFFLLNQIWALGFGILIVFVIWLVEIFFPFQGFKTKFKKLCESLHQTFGNLKTVFEESNLGWMSGYFAESLDEFDKKILQLRTELKDKIKSLEVVEIDVPQEWQKVDPPNPDPFAFSLKDLFSDLFNLDVQVEKKRKEFAGLLENLPDFYGLPIDRIEKYISDSIQQFHVDTNFPMIFEDDIRQDIFLRTVRSLSIYGNRSVISQIPNIAAVHALTEIDEKKGIFVISLETIR